MPDPNKPGDRSDDDNHKVIQGPWSDPSDVHVVHDEGSASSEATEEELDVKVTGYTSSSDDKGPSEEELDTPPRNTTGIVYGPDGVGHPTKPLNSPDNDDSDV